MGKGKKRSRNNGNNGSSNAKWTANDHVAQEDKKHKTVQQQDRTALLTHNTRAKRDAAKLQLHRTKIQRAVTELKHRLEHWDAVEEAAMEKKRLEEQAKLAQESEQQNQVLAALPVKKKGRKGPETWKLKGAARPAWEVYDFDTRYVDPHLAAHQAAADKAQRSHNVLALYKGRLLEQTLVPAHVIRDYLGLLMQLGYLSVEAKQYKSARQAWLECIELESNGDGSDDTAEASSSLPITSAREALMRMYVDLHRMDAALQLGVRFASDDSCLIRFSTALAACHVKEKDKDEDDVNVNQYMVQAVRSNIFAAYYLCHYDTFRDVIEYTDELHDSDDEPQSSLEEALEYCTSDHAQLWYQSMTRGSDNSKSHSATAAASATPVDALRRVLKDRTLLSEADLEWSHRLTLIEEQRSSSTSKSALVPESDDKDEDTTNETLDDVPSVDIKMFAGMFRTAMEMCQL